MKAYRGGEKVTRGVYWSLASGEFFQSPAQGTVLPGGREKRYIWMPAPMVLAVVPMMGLGYVIFLPLVGIAGLLAFVAQRLTGLAVRGAQEAALVAVPSWVPGVAYLVRGRRASRRRQAQTKQALPEEMQEFLGELEQDLQERRRKGEK